VFKVEQADYIANRLAAELAPLQEFREVAKNAIEAIERRRIGSPDQTGRIEFDVDWNWIDAGWYVSCADDGDGMTRAEIEKYSTTLAVIGANNNQSMTGNQGMGLKISGPTRHPQGVLIRSMKNGECTMVRLGYDYVRAEYDLLPIRDGERLVSVGEDHFPQFIRDRKSGTVVTFFGATPESNTFLPTGQPRYWLAKYLNGRFADLGNGDIRVVVRVPSGREDEWPKSRTEADERQSGESGKHFLFNTILGTMNLWKSAAESCSKGMCGVVELDAGTSRGFPRARMHWYVLPSRDDPGADVSSRTFAGGSISTLYQGELYDWRSGRAADPLFARCGILFGKSRIGLILEPQGSEIHDDFARKSVLVHEQDALRSDAWIEAWSIQFRENLPEAIKEVISREQSRVDEVDPSRRRRIQDRLREIFDMLRTPRVRKSETGKRSASDETVFDAGVSGLGGSGGTRGNEASRGSKPRGLGELLIEAVSDTSTPADPVIGLPEISVRWISESDATDFSLVESDGHGIKDRAAALIGEDGRMAVEIAANVDFRMYQSILGTLLQEFNSDGDDSRALLIAQIAREWFEQKLIETVIGVRMLENGGTWSPQALSDALDPKALTAAFISDTFHTRAAIRREIVRAVGASSQKTES